MSIFVYNRLETVPEESSLSFSLPHCRKPSTRPRPWLAFRSRCQSLRRRRREWTAEEAVEYVHSRRRCRGLPSLRRSAELDRLARLQADYMAEQREATHSAFDIEELQLFLQSMSVGENVQSGKSLRDMMTKQSSSLEDNVLGDFDEFGMATAQDDSGVVYLCQLFRGN